MKALGARYRHSAGVQLSGCDVHSPPVQWGQVIGRAGRTAGRRRAGRADQGFLLGGVLVPFPPLRFEHP